MKQLLFLGLAVFFCSGLFAQGKHAQSEGDTKLAEYVTKVSVVKKKVSVLVAGTSVTASFLDTTDFTKEFSRLNKRLSYVIVHSEEIKKLLSSLTDLQIHVVEQSLSESEAGSETMDRVKWMIVDAKGSNLIRVTASSLLKSIAMPQSVRGKRPK